MPALMFDSDEPAVLLEPRLEGCRIATYADLLTPELVAAAGPRLVVIDRGNGDPMKLATVADIEPGCLTVSAGVQLIKSWLEEKRPFPTVYHDRSEWGAVNEALAGEQAWHWVATLDGTLVPNGYYMSAVQFAGAGALGFHADVSIVWEDGWHPLPAGPTQGQLSAVIRLADQLAPGFAELMAQIKRF